MNSKNYPAFEHYNPRQAALAEARALLTQAAQLHSPFLMQGPGAGPVVGTAWGKSAVRLIYLI